MQAVPIVTAAVAYDDPITNMTYILKFPQSLYIRELHHNLLTPNQVRAYGYEINETPLQFVPADKRTDRDHSLIIDEPGVRIPLRLHGSISYFPTRKPTTAEIESEVDVVHVQMTSYKPWDPGDRLYGRNEEAIRRTIEEVDDDNDRHLAAMNTLQRHFFPDRPDTTKRLSVSTFRARNPYANFTSETLAKRWHIGLDAAKRTMEATTQMAVRNYQSTAGGRRLKHIHHQLKYKRLGVGMYTDVMMAGIKSLRGNFCMSLYSTHFHWNRAYPMPKRTDAHYSLDRLFSEVGVPHSMYPDNAPELIGGEFKRKLLRAQVNLHPVEAYTPNQNLAELSIRELKRAYRRTMRATNAPAVLWDYCMEYVASIRSHTALDVHSLQGQVPATMLTGDTADISHLCEFAWYDYVWFITPRPRELETRRLGRYLGPSTSVGEAMCAYVLCDSTKVVSRTSVFPLTLEDRNNPAVQEQMKEFTVKLNQNLGDRARGIEPDEDENDIDVVMPRYEDEDTEPLEAVEADDYETDAMDKYIAARVHLPSGDSMAYGTVRRRKRDADGHLIGRSNRNPLLDTSIYEVEFDDGHAEAYAANTIAEHVYASTDDEGFSYYLLDEIIDHRKEADAIPHSEATYWKGGRERPRKTTKGWQLCIRWKDGSTTWEYLKDIKESNPIEAATYAEANDLLKEPAFAWWAPYTLRKRARIIKAVQGRYFRRFQKYGIELPKTVKRALEIDMETGTTFWQDAIKKEMKGVLPAFKILEQDADAPVGHTKIDCHMVFDVKVDFTRKARLVAGGHMTEPPSSITYASVVTRESVRLAFLLAALNDLDVLAADIGNAYLNAACREQVYTICGPEFGEYQGRKAKIVRALYGLKSSGAAWRAHLAETLKESLEFTPCRADPDVWLRPKTKANGSTYYEYVLVYTDDILVISAKPRDVLTKLDQHFLLKPNSIGKPSTYLGATIGEYRLPDDPTKVRWSMSSERYIKEAIRNVKNWLGERGLELKNKASSVLPSSYRPELDASPYCDDDDTNYFQQQIGVLRWAVELGRIDICCEVSMLASYCAAPRIGHLNAVFHMFSYLCSHSRSRLVFDDSYVEYEPVNLPDWSDFYPDAKEEVPPNAPPPRGREVQVTVFVDADHAGDKVTRRSRTGILIFVNRSPVLWYSKRQNSIETSSFGSEFTALKVGIELTMGLRYKLRMMGVPIDGPAHIRVDNNSVVRNSSAPESVLRKKSNAIAYHFVREACAAGVGMVGYENTKSNLADMLTKTQPGPVRNKLARYVLY